MQMMVVTASDADLMKVEMMLMILVMATVVTMAMVVMAYAPPILISSGLSAIVIP